MNTKSILASKTVWVQVIAFLSTFIPAVGDWLKANPVEFVAVLGAVNVLVRFITSGHITIFPGDTGTSGLSGGVGLLLLGTALALMGSLASCSTAQMDAAGKVPINTTVVTKYGTANYSSKAGLTLLIDARSGK